jgi:hypothetical protein
MLGILGTVEDRLIAEVHRQTAAAGVSALLLGESELFSATPFSLEIDGTERSGFLQYDGRVIALSDISGLLFRLPRLWWPSAQFDLQDQIFVYHETASAWFCLLSGLGCTQINRFGLGWWVHDCCYPEQLSASAAARLGLQASEPSVAAQPPIRLFPTPVTEAERSRHVYVVGDTILPRTPGDREVAALLVSRRSALEEWQRASGISFCRLDFRHDAAIEVAYVEPMPMLDEERPELVAKIAEELTRLLL